jgi:hypothetical protein
MPPPRKAPNQSQKQHPIIQVSALKSAYRESKDDAGADLAGRMLVDACTTLCIDSEIVFDLPYRLRSAPSEFALHRNLDRRKLGDLRTGQSRGHSAMTPIKRSACCRLRRFGSIKRNFRPV